MNPLIAFDLGDVTDKGLFRTNEVSLRIAVRMLLHPMLAMSRLDVTANRLNQEIAFSKIIKEAIPTQFDPLRITFRLQ